MDMSTSVFPIAIEALAYGGQGVGRRADGKVVFVPLTVPGDRVQVLPVREHASYCEARLIEIITPAPVRTDPRCPHFRACGGCDWQHIDYRPQLAWKQRLLEDALQKISRHPAFRMFDAVPAPQTYGYRCHTRLQWRRAPSALGYFRKRSHAVLDCEVCPILNPCLADTLAGLRTLLATSPLHAITELDLYAPEDEVQILAHARRRLEALDRRTLQQFGTLAGVTGCSVLEDGDRNARGVFGETHFTYHLALPERTLTLSGGVGGFIQANPAMNARLVAHVRELAQGAQRVLDLYGGCGNFGLPLAALSASVVAVERDPRLATLGQQNAEANGLPVRFVRADARRALQDQDHGGFDTIVLDPPREGAKELTPYLPKLSPERIIYVSCNPTTLARDLGRLTDQGYALASLRLFDMFPQTFHIECVAELRPCA